MHPSRFLTTTTSLWLAAALAAQAPDFEASSITYDTGTSLETRMPWSMQQADLDADGDLDVVIVSGAAVPRLTVLANRGDGSFEAPVHYTTASGFWDDAVDLAVADLDLDGDTDVVVTNTGNTGTGSAVSVHLNDGDGTFAPRLTYPTGQGPTGIVATDLDGDGRPDLATANYARIGQGSSVSVLFADPAGGYLAPQHITVGPAPYKITAGDLDRDGRTDLVVALDGHEVVVVNNTTSGFTTTSYPVFPNQYAGNVYPSVELADLDNDGDLDAVYSNTKTGFQPLSGSGAIAVLRNDGHGEFGTPLALATIPEAQGAVEFAIADWNRDGWPDIASTHMHDGEWLLFDGNGLGGFRAPRRFQTGEYAIDLDAADVNGDQLPDMLVLERHSLGLAVYENELLEPIADPVSTPMINPSLSVSRNIDAADIDADGDLDLAVSYGGVSNNAGGIGIIRNRGDGTFTAPQMLAAPVKTRAVRFRDLDGDGDRDLVWADDFPPYQFHVRLNDGAGQFATQVDWNSNGCRIGDLEAFDFDADGDLDIAIALDAFCNGQGQQPFVLRRNRGDATFDPVQIHWLSTFASDIENADLNGDGIEDLITNSGFQGIEVSLGVGDGTFGTPWTGFTDWGPGSITVADFDGDGALDIATSNKGADKDGSTVTVLKGFGDGFFWPPVNYWSAYDPTLSNDGTIVAGDADGDGDIDLMTGNWSSKDVTFLRNRGDGTFEPQVRYGAGDETFDLVFADFNGDQIDDLAVGVVPGQSLSFYPAVIVLEGTGGSTWRDLGHGLAGTGGMPRLSSDTPMGSSSTLVLDLTSARPSSAGVHLLGVDYLGLPLLGGVIVPDPVFSVPFATTASGTDTLLLPVGSGLPAGLQLFFQSWVLDPAGPQGLAASNGLRGTQY